MTQSREFKSGLQKNKLTNPKSSQKKERKTGDTNQNHYSDQTPGFLSS